MLEIKVKVSKEALTTVEKVTEALKPGGYFWLRGAGKQSSDYQRLSQWAISNPYEVQQIDDDVISVLCKCSGYWQEEPCLFFEPQELTHFINRKGLKVVHSQVIPEKGQANIMYGKDWIHKVPPDELFGFISILAQK